MPKLADIYNCSGCLSCVESCNTGALFSRWNEEGHLTYGVDPDKCVECHRCERNCPAINGYVHGSNDLSLSTPYAAWCKDDNLRARSTSGGVFAALAERVLRKGGVVVGASMLNNEIKHIIIDKEEDLYLLQGSKYAQSDTTGIYHQVYEYLKKNTLVLFSGLGCQVAGLLNYLPPNKEYNNLYTIDIICGGVPSRYLISKYVAHESHKIKEIFSFRNKNVYEFSVVNQEGQTEVIPLSLRPLPLCGFYTELTNKHICYDCRYVGAHRQSDMTIGDYWGDREFVSQHNKGLSIAVAHSPKIKLLLLESNVEVHEVGWNDFLLHNSRMVYGKNHQGNSIRRKRLAESIQKDSYKKFVIDYANGATLRQPIYFIRKVAVYLVSRLKKDKRKQYVIKLLKDNGQ